MLDYLVKIATLLGCSISVLALILYLVYLGKKIYKKLKFKHEKKKCEKDAYLAWKNKKESK